MIAGFLVAALTVLPIEGEVSEECVTAVRVPDALYFAASQDRPDALWDELRIRNAKGETVPYVRREAQVRRERTVKSWLPLAVTGVVEREGSLVVQAELRAPERDRFGRLLALRVRTPLRDFEQTVTIAADGRELARGTLSDYSRYANFSRSEIDFDIPVAGRYTITFASPVSEAESAAFERTITADGSGSVTAKAVRDTIVRRPFRIDGIEVAFPRTEVDFVPTPDEQCDVRATVTRDDRAKKTLLDFNTGGMPVRSVAANVRGSNFSRQVLVLERRNAGWTRIGGGKVRAIDLPGEHRQELQLRLDRSPESTALRLEIDDGDNPPLDLAELPVRLFVRPNEAVFIARPGERYRAELEPGGTRPKYDSVVLDYIRRVRDPKQLAFAAFDEAGLLAGSASPVPLFLYGLDWVSIASVAAFLVLAVVCWRLLKGGTK